MDNENKKLRSSHEKAERKRLIRLAESCYNLDPRIRREREEEAAEKQRKKDDKKNFKA
jgi:hypothetical protein